jgi:hypothetical protein
MNTLLVDLDSLRFVKAAEGPDAIRCLEYWADIIIPKKDFYIGLEQRREFSIFTLMELKMLYRKASGQELETDVYSKAIDAVYKLSQDIVVDHSSIGDLVKKLGKPLKAPEVKPQIEKRVSSVATSTVSKSGSRPKSGTTTARVWEIADELRSEWTDYNSKEFRAKVIELCSSETINPSTAATQFAKWKNDLNQGCNGILSTQ